MSIVPLVIQGASLGLSACLSPGPLFMYLISQSMLGGWKRGSLVAVAPLISDIPLVLIILLALNRIPASFLRMISVLGGLYVIYMAWRLFHAWRWPQVIQQDVPVNVPKNMLRAVLVNYSSPGPYMFWTLVNGPLLLSALRISILHGIGFLISFYGIFIGGMLLLAGICSQARRLPALIIRSLALVSVAILVVMGIILIYRGLLAQ